MPSSHSNNKKDKCESTEDCGVSHMNDSLSGQKDEKGVLTFKAEDRGPENLL